MGRTGNVEGVFGETLYAVLRACRIGFFGALIRSRIFHGFKGTKGILETLDGLGQTAFGVGVGLMANMLFAVCSQTFTANIDVDNRLKNSIY
jgi:hypothetical protein